MQIITGKGWVRMKRTLTTVGPLIIVAERNRVPGSETTEEVRVHSVGHLDRRSNEGLHDSAYRR